MDLSSLSSNLPSRRPPPSDDPVNMAFKEAALSLTTLYKASQGARDEGYKDAVDDLHALFCEKAHERSPEETLSKLRNWLDERRRKAPDTTAADEAVAQQQQDAALIFDTEPILPVVETSSTLTTPNAQSARFSLHAHRDRHRQRTSSPVMTHRTYSRNSTGERHERQSSEETERRDRSSAVKRRVLGPFDSLNDFHKRGRFG